MYYSVLPEMNFENLLATLMNPTQKDAYQQAEATFQALRYTPDFINILSQFISRYGAVDKQISIFLLTQIKIFAQNLYRCDETVRQQFLVYIHDIIVKLQYTDCFDLAIETMCATLSYFATSELYLVIPTTLFVSAYARLSKTRISSRKQFNLVFYENYKLLLNADGIYGLIDALQPIPPTSYGECLHAVLDAVLNQFFTRKNNKLLRLICLSASKMQSSQRSKKENAQFFDAVRERNAQIQEFCYKRIKANEFICDNILILTYLLKINLEFQFDNLQQLLSLCIQIFRDYFQQKYTEQLDFHLTSDLEFLLEEDAGIIAAAAGLFTYICNKLQEHQIHQQICEKKQRLLADTESFFVESLQIMLLMKSWKLHGKTPLFYETAFSLIEQYAGILTLSVLTNTWATWALDHFFVFISGQNVKYNYIIPILNGQAAYLAQMSSTLQISNCVRMILNRLQEIYTEKHMLGQYVVAALDSHAILQGLARIMLIVPEHHYLFMQSLDALKIAVQLLPADKWDVAVSFGNAIIAEPRNQVDKFAKMLEVVILIFTHCPRQLNRDSAQLLFSFVETALQQFIVSFSADQYSILHGCSQAIYLLAANFADYRTAIYEQFMTFYHQLWQIMTTYREYFAECLEGILSLTRYLRPTRENIVFATYYEPFKFVQLLYLCLAECVCYEDLQLQLFVDVCEFPINWVLLALASCARVLRDESTFSACYLLYNRADTPKGSLARFLGGDSLASGYEKLASHALGVADGACFGQALGEGWELLTAAQIDAVNWLCYRQVLRVQYVGIFSQTFYQGSERLVNDILESVVV